MSNIKAIIISFIVALTLFLNLSINPALATGVYDLPVISAGEDVWVYDDSDSISRSTEGQLSSSLKKLANETGNEVRMVVINRIDYGDTIDTLTDGIFTKWYPTPEEQTNETLFVLDTLTNRSSIKSGSESNALLTDDISQRNLD